MSACMCHINYISPLKKYGTLCLRACWRPVWACCSACSFCSTLQQGASRFIFLRLGVNFFRVREDRFIWYSNGLANLGHGYLWRTWNVRCFRKCPIFAFWIRWADVLPDQPVLFLEERAFCSAENEQKQQEEGPTDRRTDRTRRKPSTKVELLTKLTQVPKSWRALLCLPKWWM